MLAEQIQPLLPAVNALTSADEKLPNLKIKSAKRKARREAWKIQMLEDILQTEKQQLPVPASAFPEPVKPDDQPKPEVMKKVFVKPPKNKLSIRGLMGLFTFTTVLSLVPSLLSFFIWILPEGSFTTWVLLAFRAVHSQSTLPSMGSFLITAFTLYGTNINNSLFKLIPDPENMYWELFSATKGNPELQKSSMNSVRGYTALLVYFHLPRQVYKKKFQMDYGPLLTHLRYNNYLKPMEVHRLLKTNRARSNSEQVESWLKELPIKPNTVDKFLDELKTLKTKLKPIRFFNKIIVPLSTAIVLATWLFLFCDFSDPSLPIYVNLITKIGQMWFSLTMFMLSIVVSDPYDTRNFFFSEIIKKKNIKTFYDELDGFFDEELRKI
ncbi:hypothetical protein DAPPUDRAFT_98360 [Daphnia pulex]|uniref:Uncharacterized protein n=1 Tax=Daphnia pulex TaxID=6669 RepID=E9G3F3_DAPPU|nr:hypothetical protein DAPPUDRAFT_98360 [Daphnia pulex]|eukprot:EFX85999.1 hypothetical protein DAPPUDRAFT_98360 [Daphnia pulex]